VNVRLFVRTMYPPTLSVCVFVDEHEGGGVDEQSLMRSENSLFWFKAPDPVITLLPQEIVGGLKLSLTTVFCTPIPGWTAALSG